MDIAQPTREVLLHRLYEAAELEHNLMCTYLYAAFSLKDANDGLSADEAAATARWRRTILQVAIEEMGHLCAVWNITSALGGAPRFGRGNFPLDPGYLPAGVVVKLAPFNEAVLQHFIYLERPKDSTEPDGAGFEPPVRYRRASPAPRLTPMGLDYDTVGDFYVSLGESVTQFVARVGEKTAFCGDPALQLSADEIDLGGAKPVICSKTALAAFDAIVRQGEGAQADSEGSHYQKFAAIRREFRALEQVNASFNPAFPAAVNPVLRRPPRPEGRVWIENEDAAECVDLANAAYGLMVRLISYSYGVPRPAAEKAAAVDLGIGLMQAMTLLAERAARLPAGPSNPQCHAGVTFVALRDAAGFPPGVAARRFFIERLAELAQGAATLAATDERASRATRLLEQLAERSKRDFDDASSVTATPSASVPAPVAASAPPVPNTVAGVEEIEGKHLTLVFDAKKCIHSRFCVTWAPNVFLANVQGPWIHPDATDVERLVEVAHVCPSGAIRYRRKDGHPDEPAPLVNLIAIRENGPYAVRANMRLDGRNGVFRATLCRCGASKNKPFCDGSHNEVKFTASGEPLSGKTDMLAARDGVLSVDPETDGPLRVRGNLEITSGTGRVVARITQARLCRCGGSGNKPFCDGTHAKIGFRSTDP
ncbi:MAG: CDGSH iron-sulfur domain-containing protein [Gammaproteobacteria bacterium]|nr:CDGSH iron-sulfur domain-containing protein [Gammaproteobacteria bacterium]